MEQLNIRYGYRIKNKDRGTMTFYGRVLEKGLKPYEIALKTTDESEARKWQLRQETLLSLYNEDIAAGRVPVVQPVRRAAVAAQVGHETTVTEAMNGYLEWCEVRRNLRATTLANYRANLKPIVKYCEANGIKTLRLINEHDVGKMADSIAHLGGRSRQEFVLASNRFGEWCRKQYKVENVFECLPRFKVDIPEHVVWTWEQMMEICKNAPNKEVECYWSILALTGCRNTELALARWSDFNGEVITLRAENTKSRKSRPLPLVRTLAVNLAYLKKANEGKDEDLIFPHLSVKNGRRNIQLRRVLTKLGLRGTLHTFRHSAAAYYLSKGVPIKTVSSLLGHASETTTLRVYMEMTKEQEITAAVKSVYRDQENSGNNAELPSRQQELSEMLFKGDLDGLTNFGK